MELQIVSYELAKKLRGIGFNEKVGTFFITGNPDNIKENICLVDWNKEHQTISAPTQALAQMWFREKYKLYIEPLMIASDKWDIAITDFKELPLESVGDLRVYPYKTYEEALEAGLIRAVELVKNKE